MPRTIPLSLLVLSTLCAQPLYAQSTGQASPAQSESSSSANTADPYRWEGEELYFSVRINNAEAIRAGMRVGTQKRKDQQSYVPITAQARTVGLFRKIYPLDDRADTYINPATMRPIRAKKIFDERGRWRSYSVNYTHRNFRAQVTKKYFLRRGETDESKQRKRRFIRAIPGTTHDMVSWLFELRTATISKIGERYIFFVYDGWKLSRVSAKVVGKDDVHTPLGLFKAWRIEFTREVLRSRPQHNYLAGRRRATEPQLKPRAPAKPTGTLWVSRDENLIPIKFSLPTKVGVGEALLTKYKPALHAKVNQGRRAQVTARKD